MTEVVRSACPGCRRSLNIPADWAGKVVRCKFCGSAMQVVQRVAAPIAAAVPMAMPAAATVPSWEPLPAEAPLPEFSPPVAPLPTMPVPVAPAPGSRYVSAFDAKDRYVGRGSYRGPKKRDWLKHVVIALIVIVGGSTLGLAAVKMGLFKSRSTEPANPIAGGGNGEGGTGSANGQPVEPAGNGAFPRRMLAISIHSYLYANPLHNGDSGFAVDDAKRTGTDAAVRRLAERWRVPKEQLYHLTDARLLGEKDGKAAKKDDSKSEPPRRLSKVMPLKSVVEGTISKFLETSRAQDHIVIVFCGHVLDKKGEVYLVPIDGDLDEIDSLIPLKWFYDKLAACPAQEKVIIYDVCRFHPERGIERPYPGPMTETMEKALHDSPDGVTVVTSCSKGEQSIELDYYNTQLSFDTAGVKGSGVNLTGSFFLSLFHAASIAGALSPEKKLPAPGDELPVERMTKWMKEKLAEVVHHRFIDRTQTLKATIKRRAEPIAYNPSEPCPRISSSRLRRRAPIRSR